MWCVTCFVNRRQWDPFYQLVNIFTCVSALIGIYRTVSDLFVQGKAFITLSAQRRDIDYANLLNVAHSCRDSITIANIGCLVGPIFQERSDESLNVGATLKWFISKLDNEMEFWLQTELYKLTSYPIYIPYKLKTLILFLELFPNLVWHFFVNMNLSTWLRLLPLDIIFLLYLTHSDIQRR